MIDMIIKPFVLNSGNKICILTYKLRQTETSTELQVIVKGHTQNLK